MHEITEKMLRHLDLVLEANKTTNLTAITSREKGILLHVEDSLAGLDELNAAPEGLYCDLGTGGGFPGVTLALASKRNTVLVDSVRKKTEILNSVIDDLGVGDRVSTYWGRIEDFSVQYNGEAAVVTARALSQLVSLVELSAPLLKIGGRLICYKAEVSEEELSRVSKNLPILGMSLIKTEEYVLSDNETKRSLYVFEKTGTPKIKLPRKTGMAQKKPL